MLCRNHTGSEDDDRLSFEICVYGTCNTSGVCECFEGFEHLQVFTFNTLCDIASTRKTIILVTLGFLCSITAAIALQSLVVRQSSAFVRGAATAAAWTGVLSSLFFYILAGTRSATPFTFALLYASIATGIYMACLLVMGLIQPIHRLSGKHLRWFRKKRLQRLIYIEALAFLVLEIIASYAYKRKIRGKLMLRVTLTVYAINATVGLYIFWLLRAASRVLADNLNANLEQVPQGDVATADRVVRFTMRIQNHRKFAQFLAFGLCAIACTGIAGGALGYVIPEEASVYSCIIIPFLVLLPTLLFVDDVPLFTRRTRSILPKKSYLKELNRSKSHSGGQAHDRMKTGASSLVLFTQSVEATN